MEGQPLYLHILGENISQEFGGSTPIPCPPSHPRGVTLEHMLAFFCLSPQLQQSYCQCRCWHLIYGHPSFLVPKSLWVNNVLTGLPVQNLASEQPGASALPWATHPQ